MVECSSKAKILVCTQTTRPGAAPIVTIGERNLIALLDKYGKETVQACIAELLNLAEQQMRRFIAAIPDGTYQGSAILEDAGHGFGDIAITATVVVQNDTMHVTLNSPP